jgi:hypothetical protein
MGLNLMKNLAALNLWNMRKFAWHNSVSKIFLERMSTLPAILGLAPSC